MVADSSRIGCRYQRLRACREEECSVNFRDTAGLVGGIVNYILLLEEHRTGWMHGDAAVAVSLRESTAFYHHYHGSGMIMPTGFGARLKHQIGRQCIARPAYMHVDTVCGAIALGHRDDLKGGSWPCALPEPKTPSANAPTSAAAPNPHKLRRRKCSDCLRPAMIPILFMCIYCTSDREDTREARCKSLRTHWNFPGVLLEPPAGLCLQQSNLPHHVPEPGVRPDIVESRIDLEPGHHRGALLAGFLQPAERFILLAQAKIDQSEVVGGDRDFSG